MRWCGCDEDDVCFLRAPFDAFAGDGYSWWMEVMEDALAAVREDTVPPASVVTTSFLGDPPF
jgi:hypothetical protein